MVLLLVLAVVLLLRWYSRYGDLVSQSSQVSPEGDARCVEMRPGNQMKKQTFRKSISMPAGRIRRSQSPPELAGGAGALGTAARRQAAAGCSLCAAAWLVLRSGHRAGLERGAAGGGW